MERTAGGAERGGGAGGGGGGVGGVICREGVVVVKVWVGGGPPRVHNDLVSTMTSNFISQFSTYLPSPPPVRVTVGEVRYSIEIDVGGGGSKGSILQNQILRKILAENGPHV